MVIRQYHTAVGHSGTSHTWSEIRQRFWIVKGGAVVRNSIGKCVLCKKRNSTVGRQLMADLPAGRLQIHKPSFFSVGIDYFGAFLIKQKRSLVKRYGCVFTCLTTRAIHIEVAHSLSTDSFICALKRFIAWRGKPRYIYLVTMAQIFVERIESYAVLWKNGIKIRYVSLHWKKVSNGPLTHPVRATWEAPGSA